MISRISLSLLLVLSLTLSSCGPPRRTAAVNFVEGTVTLDGQPLKEAFIQFVPRSGVGEVAGGYSDAAGKYVLSSLNGDSGKGAEVGEYLVTVSKIERTNSWPPGADTNVVAPTVTEKEIVPKVYTDQKDSPLSKTVNKGKNKIDLELSSK